MSGGLGWLAPTEGHVCTVLGSRLPRISIRALYISSAVPSKNLPQPATNRVSPAGVTRHQAHARLPPSLRAQPLLPQHSSRSTGTARLCHSVPQKHWWQRWLLRQGTPEPPRHALPAPPTCGQPLSSPVPPRGDKELLFFAVKLNKDEPPLFSPQCSLKSCLSLFLFHAGAGVGSGEHRDEAKPQGRRLLLPKPGSRPTSSGAPALSESPVLSSLCCHRCEHRFMKKQQGLGSASLA